MKTIKQDFNVNYRQDWLTQMYRAAGQANRVRNTKQDRVIEAPVKEGK